MCACSFGILCCGSLLFFLSYGTYCISIATDSISRRLFCFVSSKLGHGKAFMKPIHRRPPQPPSASNTRRVPLQSHNDQACETAFTFCASAPPMQAAPGRLLVRDKSSEYPRRRHHHGTAEAAVLVEWTEAYASHQKRRGIGHSQEERKTGNAR